MDKDKKMIIFTAVFFVVIIIAVIYTEISTKDYTYSEPVEVAAVVTDKNAIKKSSRVGSKAGKKNKSSNYDYYVYVKLEDDEEVKIKCRSKAQYDQCTEGQSITVYRQEMFDKGEFLKMVYSLKE